MAEAAEIQEDDLTSALAEAWDEVEGKDDGTEPETGTEDESASAVGDDATAEGTAESESDGGTDADDPAVQSADKRGGDAPAEKTGEQLLNAPSSWKPEMREKFKDLPKEVQDYVHQRESEVEQGIMQYAENAKRAQAMDQMLQPFQQYMAMNGGPGQTIQGLLQTGAGLQMGTPVQKAEVVANIIRQFGVDIQTLDNLLVGKQPGQGAQQSSEIQSAVQQAVAPYQQFMNDFQQQQQMQNQQMQQSVDSDVTQFANDPANEFYEDVKMDMADLLELAANRGQTLSLKDAYDRACKLHPEIDQILSTRAAAKAANDKRQAASSITGSPGGDGSNAAPDSMRAAIEQAWDGTGRL